DASMTPAEATESMPGQIIIQFKSTKTSVRDCYWVQFLYRYAKDDKGDVEGVVYPLRHKSGTKTFTKYEKIGKKYIHCDTGNTSIRYDSIGYHIRSQEEITIDDSPTPMEEDKYKESGAVGDTYLVCDDKVLYHVTWERKSVKGENGKWTTAYTARGEPATQF